MRLVACGLLALLLTANPGTASEETANPRELEASVPSYRIYPLRNGTCRVKGKYAFRDNEDDPESYEYALYVWLLLGGEKPVLIDAGLSDVDSMNRGAAEVFAEPIRQAPQERTHALLKRLGLGPEDIGHVLVTHLHFDHVDQLFEYTNATLYVGKKEWELASANDGRGSWCDGRILFPLLSGDPPRKRLRLIEDGPVLPGIECFWVGGHTPGSLAYRVRTKHGHVVLTGDTISLLENLKRPVGVAHDPDEVDAAIPRILGEADVVLPSHDPGTIGRWPPLPAGTPRYTIRPIRVGECDVTDEITFQDRWGDDQSTRRYSLYVWLIEGGPSPVIVDTGPNPRYVEEFGRATAKYIPGGIRQKPEEDTLRALRAAGVEAGAIRHVIVTHCHGDHYDYFGAFPNARLVIQKEELAQNRERLAPDVQKALQERPEALVLVGDEEVLPGIRTVSLGCHTPGSQGILVQTWLGPVMLCGDVVYLYENIEENRPGRSPDPEACIEAMAKIRSLADIVLPAHDPEVLERWPTGVVGSR